MVAKNFKVALVPVDLRLRHTGERLSGILAEIEKARAAGAAAVVLPSFPCLSRADADRIVGASAGLAVFAGDGQRVVAAENGAPLSSDCDGVFSTARLGRVAAIASPEWTKGGAPLPQPTQGLDAIAICDCMPFARGRISARADALARFARAASAPIAYANACGVRDIGKVARAFDGAAVAVGPGGEVRAACRPFAPAAEVVDFDGCGAPSCGGCGGVSDGIAEVTAAIRHGVSRFLAELGLERVIIGVSGGIDSAVATAIYGSILPPENLLLVAMPGPFTSGTTRRLGKALAANAGARFAEIPIGPSVELTRREFEALETEGPGDGGRGKWALSSFAMENVQARDRGSRVLAAAAASFGAVVSCNANKTEAAIGYGTLHGDIFGWLSCLGDLWKGDVYAVGRELNASFYNRELIPEGIFQVKPSAELSDKQAVEKGLGDPLVYPYHDKLFRSWVECGDTAADSLAAFRDGTLAARIGYEGDISGLFAGEEAFSADLGRWWKLYRGLAVAKRMQAPPVMAVTEAPFGSVPESQLDG